MALPARCKGASTELLDRFTVMRLSARNQLQGTVVSVDLGSVMAIVVVRLAGGDEIVSAITKESAEDLGLREGDSVTAVIKATEVMVGKE